MSATGPWCLHAVCSGHLSGLGWVTRPPPFTGREMEAANSHRALRAGVRCVLRCSLLLSLRRPKFSPVGAVASESHGGKGHSLLVWLQLSGAGPCVSLGNVLFPLGLPSRLQTPRGVWNLPGSPPPALQPTWLLTTGTAGAAGATASSALLTCRFHL